MIEEWRDIAGYEGLYQVSDCGRVKSLAFMQRYLLRTGVVAMRRTKERILFQGVQNSGYVLVYLWRGDKQKACTVHRLVAQAFLPASDKRTVNHKDGDKSNNRVGNLEWSTYAENLAHARKTGLNRHSIRVTHPVTGRQFESIKAAAAACKISHRTVRKTFTRSPQWT